MIADSEALKERGKEEFKRGEFGKALASFTQAAEGLKKCLPDPEATKVYLMCLTNGSASATQLKQFQTAIDLCTEALALEPSNSKALYRRACSYKELGESREKQNNLEDLEDILLLYTQARDDFTRLFESVDNKDARGKWNEVKQDIARIKILLKDRPKPVSAPEPAEHMPRPKQPSAGPNPTEKRLIDYNVQVACSMVKDKIEKELLEESMPEFRSEL
jgi:tetratricopeptide (TPR) repeat protein